MRYLYFKIVQIKFKNPKNTHKSKEQCIFKIFKQLYVKKSQISKPKGLTNSLKEKNFLF